MKGIAARLEKLEAQRPARRRAFVVIAMADEADTARARHIERHPDDGDAEFVVIVTGVSRREPEKACIYESRPISS
ncbi:hypothetical protein WDZ92_30970 [Nostoc sp. NIES-2111]